MKKTIIYVKDMDCPCEENMIKMKIGKFNIKTSFADISKRQFTVIHDDDESEILKAVDSLNLGSSLLLSEVISDDISCENKNERKVLVYVLLINFTFFILEILFGILSNSMGLVADSLDMLSDSLVYIMALFAVSAALATQKKIAFISGIFQIFLAAIGLFEVLRRFMFNEYDVDYTTMIVISFFALIANWLCLLILNKSDSQKPHMKASLIFTSNDIVINFGVILAGVLVLALNSNIPDLVIGSLVFLVVCRGAYRILKI